jgi:hypothetical protein
MRCLWSLLCTTPCAIARNESVRALRLDRAIQAAYRSGLRTSQQAMGMSKVCKDPGSVSAANPSACIAHAQVYNPHNNHRG